MAEACARNPRHIAQHMATAGPTRIGALCCECMDEFMVECSLLVPPAEGEEGLRRFRARHETECGYRPPILDTPKS